jgi:hypothetical protein
VDETAVHVAAGCGAAVVGVWWQRLTETEVLSELTASFLCLPPPPPHTMPCDRPFADWIENHQDHLIARLAESVAIASVSGDIAYRPQCHEMGAWLKTLLEAHSVS